MDNVRNKDSFSFENRNFDAKTGIEVSCFSLEILRLGNQAQLKLCNNSRFFRNLPPAEMNKRCSNCKLVNYLSAENCVRCGDILVETAVRSRDISLGMTILKRLAVLIAACVIALGGFYASLVFSAKSLSREEHSAVSEAIRVLDEKGFSDEVFLLKHLAVFRSNDNWLNASVAKENAFAATNFPFEIVTLYPDFFTYPADSVERAAILLHEAKHLQGAEEKEAYEFVWKNRERLGWTRDKYADSEFWQNLRRQTKEYSPNLFVCDFNPSGDCTE